MEMKKNPKNPKKYICSTCDFHTGNKKDFERHVLTAKHQKNIFGNVGNKMEMSKNPTFVCECNKIFCTNSAGEKKAVACCENCTGASICEKIYETSEHNLQSLNLLIYFHEYAIYMTLKL